MDYDRRQAGTKTSKMNLGEYIDVALDHVEGAEFHTHMIKDTHSKRLVDSALKDARKALNKARQEYRHNLYAQRGP